VADHKDEETLKVELRLLIEQSRRLRADLRNHLISANPDGLIHARARRSGTSTTLPPGVAEDRRKKR
jgi:hypothetical protein